MSYGPRHLYVSVRRNQRPRVSSCSHVFGEVSLRPVSPVISFRPPDPVRVRKYEADTCGTNRVPSLSRLRLRPSCRTVTGCVSSYIPPDGRVRPTISVVFSLFPKFPRALWGISLTLNPTRDHSVSLPTGFTQLCFRSSRSNLFQFPCSEQSSEDRGRKLPTGTF